VEYEEIIESLCYEYRGLYKSNYQEDLITTWYQWIGLIYRDHPFVYKTLRALQLINNDPFFEDFDTGYKVIEHADITEAIHTAETGLKVIAVYSVLENTTNRDNLEFLNCVIQSLHLETDPVICQLPEILLRRHQYFPQREHKCDTEEALREFHFVTKSLVGYRRHW
jgi:hypothetical protein